MIGGLGGPAGNHLPGRGTRASGLVTLYRQLGAYLSRKIESAEWGDGVVEELADLLARRYPGCGSSTTRTGATRKCRHC